MNVRDLITELEKFPDLSTVFIDYDGAEGIQRLGDTSEIWVRSADGSGIHGPFTEVTEDAEDYGIVLL